MNFFKKKVQTTEEDNVIAEVECKNLNDNGDCDLIKRIKSVQSIIDSGNASVQAHNEKSKKSKTFVLQTLIYKYDAIEKLYEKLRCIRYPAFSYNFDKHKDFSDFYESLKNFLNSFSESEFGLLLEQLQILYGDCCYEEEVQKENERLQNEINSYKQKLGIK
jgi:hypothetical protein